MKSLASLLIGGAMIAIALVWINRPRPAVPPTFDSAVLAKSDRAPDLQELGVIIEQAAAGFDVAQNNLAIIAMRSPRGLIEVNADALLAQAAAQGNMAARYNLALRLPNKFDTDPEIVQRRIDLLTPNAEAGDPHSQVLLAKTLSYVNRDAYVEDRAALELDLLRRAAESGDMVYQLLYAKELYARYRDSNDAAQWYEAADLLHAVYQAGDGRGAEYLGFMLRGRPPSPRDGDAALPSHDPLYWYRAAADTGLATAQCSVGLMTYGPVEGLLPEGGRSITEIHDRLAQHSDEDRARARTHLDTCAALDKLPRAPFYDAERRKAFGAPSVYRRKQTAGWTSLTGQNDDAGVLLGLMYLHGIDVAQDVSRAKAYLTRAGTGNDRAQSVLDKMQSP